MVKLEPGHRERAKAEVSEISSLNEKATPNLLTILRNII